MKLASLKSGRDGRLVVVSNDLAWFTDAGTVAPTLQAALDDWERCEPMLRAPAARLSVGRRLGLCEPCGAGAPRPRGGDAAELLD